MSDRDPWEGWRKRREERWGKDQEQLRKLWRFHLYTWSASTSTIVGCILSSYEAWGLATITWMVAYAILYTLHFRDAKRMTLFHFVIMAAGVLPLIVVWREGDWVLAFFLCGIPNVVLYLLAYAGAPTHQPKQ